MADAQFWRAYERTRPTDEDWRVPEAVIARVLARAAWSRRQRKAQRAARALARAYAMPMAMAAKRPPISLRSPP